MKAAIHSLILLLFISTPLLSADRTYTREEFTRLQSSVKGRDDGVELCKDFVQHTSDFDLLRDVQDAWAKIDPTGVRDFFRARYEANKRSTRDIYLHARLLASKPERIKFGRKLIEIDPDWPYGYRLVCYTYCIYYFEGRDETVRLSLAKEFPTDEPLFDKYDRIETDRQFADKVRYKYLTFKQRTSEAEKVMARAKSKKWDWAVTAADTNTGVSNRGFIDSSGWAEKYRNEYGEKERAEFKAKLSYYREASKTNITGEAFTQMALCFAWNDMNDSALFYFNRAMDQMEAMIAEGKAHTEKTFPHLFAVELLQDRVVETVPDTPRWLKFASRRDALEKCYREHMPDADREFITLSGGGSESYKDRHNKYLDVIQTTSKLAKDEKYDLALETWKKLDGWEKSPSALFSIAKLYAKKKDFDRAFTALNQGLTLIGDDPAADLFFGYLDVYDLDSTWIPMHDDPRWKPIGRRIALAKSRLPIMPFEPKK